MDYGRPQGTGLWKYQWDLIHDPQTMLFAWAQEEEEGALKSGDDLITDVLGKIKCAKASNRSKIFIGSNGRYVLGKNKTPEFYAELYLGDNKSRYDYYDINLTYTKTEYNSSKYKYDFGNDLYIMVSKEKSNVFETYLSNSDFTTEYNTISQLIANDKASEAIDELYDFSYCVYEKLSIPERKKLLLAFADKTFLPENYEDMVLNLLRSSYTSGEKEGAKAALNAIFNKRIERGIVGQLADKRERTLFDVLTSGMDDVNGKANYSEWIKELTNLFTIAYSEELKNGKYPDGVTVFPNGMAISSSTPYYFYNWNYVGGSDVSLYLDKYRLNLVNGTKEVRPNDIINVHFGRDFEFTPEGTKPVIAMPAFCLVYLLNHEQSKLKADVAKFIITSVNIYGASRKLIVTKGSKFLASLALLKEVADPVFGNEDFQAWAEKELGLSTQFFKMWDYINAIEVTKASASSIVGVVTKQNWFGTFYTNWKAIQANEQLENKITAAKVKELNQAINDVKNHLDNEDIVY